VRTVAVFGGSFDPPHVGHVLAVSWVLATAPIDAVWVVPALEHAFGKKLRPFAHRRRMAELAFASLRGVEVSDVEARLGGASYTVRTLEELRRRHPDLDFRLVIGSDLVEQVPRWKEGARLPSLAPLLVVGRGGHADGRALAMPEVSSTEVRERLRAGLSVEGLVPRRVLEYAEQHGLYRG
jgi:nicotinate-nucleotide adenylyltransferase